MASQSVFILAVSIIVALVNIIHVIIGWLETPVGMRFMGIGHYFLDYFEYVQQIAQGSWGRWLVENQFSHDDPTKTFLGWGQYLILGKIGKLVNLSPMAIYWVSIFIFSVIVAVLAFILIQRLLGNKGFLTALIAWLMFICAAPFYVNSTKPLALWYAPSTLYDRFGHVPHHLVSTVLCLIIILWIGRLLEKLETVEVKQLVSQALIISFILIFLVTFVPFQVINLMTSVGAVSLVYWRRRQQSVKPLIILLGVLIGLVLPAAVLIKLSHSQGVLFQRSIVWEKAQAYYPPLWRIFADIGPIILFTGFGLKPYLQKSSYLRIILLAFVTASYVFYLSPLGVMLGTHNMRFLTPISYVLFSVLSVLGLRQIAVWLKINSRALIATIFILFFLYWLPVNINTPKGYFNDPAQFSSISYLPKDLFVGLRALSEVKDDKVVLTSPKVSFGMIAPVFVAKKMYVGRMVFTADMEKKVELSYRFYEGKMNQKEAEKFLQSNGIGYVILTYLDEVPAAGLINHYPFLKVFFQNDHLLILRK